MKLIQSRLLMSFLGIAAIAMLAVAVWTACKPAKFVTGRSLLIYRKDGAPGPADQNIKDDYIATHMLVLRSQAILGQAVENLKKTDFDKLDVDALQSRLQVHRAEPNSNIVRLTWYGNDEKEGPVVLTSVIDAYKEFLKSSYDLKDERVSGLLVKARETAEKQLRIAEAKQLKFIEGHPEVFVAKTESARASILEQKLFAAKLELGKLERRLKFLDQQNVDELSKAKIRVWAVKEGLPPATDKLDDLYRQFLMVDIAEKREEFEELRASLDAVTKKLIEVASLDAEEKSITDEVTRNRLFFGEIGKQVQSMRIAQNQTGFGVAILSGPTAKSNGSEK